MPELPEVETVVAGLRPKMVGKSIISSQTSGKKLRYPLPDFTSIEQYKITDIQRRAKYLLFHFENGSILVWHLGMTGQFHVLHQDDKKEKHEHVTLILNDGSSLRYRDTRRFGYAAIITDNRIEQHTWFKKLGPEPLSENFDGAYLKNKLITRKTSIKQAIMDNHVVVGVGNIYASEALFRAAIHPAQQANRLKHQQYQHLVLHIQQVLTAAIEAGGSTISDFVNADGKPGYFAHSFQVYGRQGKPCLHCHKTIEKMTQAGRASFFCPQCQLIL